jgi:HEAT repeat protein
LKLTVPILALLKPKGYNTNQMNNHSLLQVEYLLKCLTDTNPAMRTGAARTLAQYGNERAILPLIEALELVSII